MNDHIVEMMAMCGKKDDLVEMMVMCRRPPIRNDGDVWNGHLFEMMAMCGMAT